MSLPKFQTDDLSSSLMQAKWAALLNPLLANPVNSGSVLQGVNLVSGVNVISHKLGRKLQGWMLSDALGVATIYRSAPKDALTLTLTSSAAVTVDLFVF